MVDWAEGSQTDIDNSAFLIMFYFGWIGVGLVSYLLFQLRRFVAGGAMSGEVAISLLVAALGTGALWALWFCLFLLNGLVLVRTFNCRKWDVHATAN